MAVARNLLHDLAERCGSCLRQSNAEDYYVGYFSSHRSIPASGTVSRYHSKDRPIYFFGDAPAENSRNGPRCRQKRRDRGCKGLRFCKSRYPRTRHEAQHLPSRIDRKQFTAAAILLLEEHGKLRLDDRIARYLPLTQASWGSITLRHLLTHTSGIPEYEDEIDDQRDYSERQLTEFVGLLSRRSPPAKNSNTATAVTCCSA